MTRSSRTSRGARATTRSLAALAAAGLLTLSACSSSDEAMSGGADSHPAAAEREAAGGKGSVADTAGLRAGGDAPGGRADVLTERAVVATGNVVLRSDDVGEARFDVRAVVDRFRGEVTEDTTDTDDDGEISRARMVLRVPSEDFDAAVEELSRVAELVTSDTRKKDVTDQVIDTAVRLRVQERSIRRIELLLDRAQSIRDIVAIEGQLAEREAELNSLSRRSAYLADQTSMATITVSLQRVPQAEPREDGGGFLAGLSAGWQALGVFAVGLATVAGALLPWAVVLGVLGLLGRPVVRRLRRRPSATTGLAADRG